ncbi:MAG: tRNA (adenosine(37)-N6)-threonylcarbamoyltransferase complex ATPase subunit type 1 TsaE [bacterium]|nr:tRNA (adenosine(37)-N6)-threonylcarbamoyltransferase complex ATPase subunit type 1 TsaE [bacterium]MBU1917059.1 tRNA (adenosine(37)-N6)-threonylcarbamoyltransferase complex ATPase subunit type 1 TsaE [bacterium]
MLKPYAVQTISYDNLTTFSKQFTKELKPKDVVALTGVIGAGKTTFLRHLLSEMGLCLESGFSSPTFTILNQYELPNVLINHIDLYRLDSFTELEQIDLISLFEPTESMTFVEWADKFEELEPYYTKRLHFDYSSHSPTERLITCYAR